MILTRVLHVCTVFANRFSVLALTKVFDSTQAPFALTLSISATRMWANAQRDGRPAEYRWRPLFNAAKFG